MHKIKHDELLDSTNSMFNVSNNTSYNVSSNNLDYTMSKPNTNFIEKNIYYSAARLWNNLPIWLKRKKFPYKTLRQLSWLMYNYA